MCVNFADIEREYVQRHLVPSFEWVIYPLCPSIHGINKFLDGLDIEPDVRAEQAF